MKFLVDAHLPAAVCRVLREAGHDVLHTSDLPDANRTKDRAINAQSIRDRRVVVTKDTDFYYSHLLQGRPWKLLLVRTGNLRMRDLTSLFEKNLPLILEALTSNTLVELDQRGLVPVA